MALASAAMGGEMLAEDSQYGKYRLRTVVNCKRPHGEGGYGGRGGEEALKWTRRFGSAVATLWPV